MTVLLAFQCDAPFPHLHVPHCVSPNNDEINDVKCRPKGQPPFFFLSLGLPTVAAFSIKPYTGNKEVCLLVKMRAIL